MSFKEFITYVLSHLQVMCIKYPDPREHYNSIPIQNNLKWADLVRQRAETKCDVEDCHSPRFGWTGVNWMTHGDQWYLQRQR